MTYRRTAGGVVIGPQNKIIVVSQHGVSWSLPKGGVDEGETDRQAAEREIKEETGLENVEYLGDLGSYLRPRIGRHGIGERKKEMKKMIFFLYRTNDTHLAPQDKDNPEAVWLDPTDAVDRLTHQKDKIFLKSCLPTIEKHLA